MVLWTLSTMFTYAETDTGQGYSVTQDHSRGPVDLDIWFLCSALQVLCKRSLSVQTGLETLRLWKAFIDKAVTVIVKSTHAHLAYLLHYHPDLLRLYLSTFSLSGFCLSAFCRSGFYLSGFYLPAFCLSGFYLPAFCLSGFYLSALYRSGSDCRCSDWWCSTY